MKKKFIFIDNDRENQAIDDIEYTLLPWFDVEEIELKLEEIEVHSDFYHKEREEKINLVFNSELPILAYSMLTPAKYNSRGQVESLIKGAGLNGVTGKTVVFFGNELLRRFLSDLILEDMLHVVPFIQGVQRNTLIGQESGGDFFRYTFDFSKDRFQCVVKERVTLKQLFQDGN